jgi:hypothetical protein
MLGATVHDAVLDAARLERPPALLALVTLVGIDGGLVAQDERVRHIALVDMRWRQKKPADDPRPASTPIWRR